MRSQCTQTPRLRLESRSDISFRALYPQGPQLWYLTGATLLVQPTWMLVERVEEHTAVSTRKSILPVPSHFCSQRSYHSAEEETRRNLYYPVSCKGHCSSRTRQEAPFRATLACTLSAYLHKALLVRPWSKTNLHKCGPCARLQHDNY